jgi:hypothetical protein
MKPEQHILILIFAMIIPTLTIKKTHHDPFFHQIPVGSSCENFNLVHYKILTPLLNFLPELRIRITLMRIRIQLFTVMRIRMEMMGICENWSIDSPGLHFDPQSLHSRERSLPSTALYFEPLKLPNLTISGSGSNFSSNADPDPDPAYKNNVDPTTLFFTNLKRLSLL